ncbi:MAG: RsmE family RNA methyltransferase [Rubrobacteraceae bacterium]
MEAAPRSSTVSGASSGKGRVTRAQITRVFLDQTLQTGASFGVPEAESHHLLGVLRAKPGDTFEVVGEGGVVFLAELREGREAQVVEELVSGGEESVRISLYQASPKGKRMDLVVEKAVEIGATKVVPLVTDRSVVRAGEGGKLDRWRRIAESAARQSLRRAVPEVAAPTSFREALESAEGAVLLHNAPELPSLESVVESPVSLFVGPEGGWSDGEVSFAKENGVPSARIGSHRLRSETAGIVAVARAVAALEIIETGRRT